jgi:hypothetical protein
MSDRVHTSFHFKNVVVNSPDFFFRNHLNAVVDVVSWFFHTCMHACMHALMHTHPRAAEP